MEITKSRRLILEHLKKPEYLVILYVKKNDTFGPYSRHKIFIVLEIDIPVKRSKMEPV